MSLFTGKRQIMQVCNRCGGMLQTTSPRDVYEGGVYHLHCGFKVRRIDDEKKAVRDIAPPLINLIEPTVVMATVKGNGDPT